MKNYRMPTELSDEIYNKVQELSEEGNQLADNEKYMEAIHKFADAYRLLPEPKTDWEASTWLLASIGDMWHSLNDHEKSAAAMYDALNSPGGTENPFIYLRLGESLFELGDKKAAKENLLRAYMLDGKDIFENEDPKYFQVIADIV